MIKQKRKIIIFHEERCLNCGSCELACSVSHTTSRDLEKAVLSSETPVRRRWMKVSPENNLSVGCLHCVPAPCVDACITAAMQKNKDLDTVHEEEKCVGCWMCIMVCPFGAVKRITEKHHVLKCDLCSAGDGPACIDACPTKALEIIVIENE